MNETQDKETNKQTTAVIIKTKYRISFNRGIEGIKCEQVESETKRRILIEITNEYANICFNFQKYDMTLK